MLQNIKWEGEDGSWVPEFDSDEAWVTRLASALAERNEGEEFLRTWNYPRNDSLDYTVRPGLDLLWRYFINRPPLPQVTANWKRAASYEILRICRANHAENVILSVADRIRPIGWWTAMDSDGNGDDLCAEIAAVNGMAEKFGEALTWTLVMADSYMIVGDQNEDGIPLITHEDPRVCITHEDAWGRTTKALRAVVNEWTGEPGYVLFGKGYYREATFIQKLGRLSWLGEPQTTRGLEGDVQVVRMRNQNGVGDFENHLDDIDRIHVGILSRVDIARFQAHRQRWVENLPDTNPAGEEIQYDQSMFIAEPGTMWRLPEGSKIGESMPVDIGPLRLAVKDDVETFYTNTRTPLHYVSPEAAEGSAEGAGLQREAHVFRVETRQGLSDTALAKVMSLALKVRGEAERAPAHRIRTIWAPTERYTMNDRASAASQAAASGLPWEQRMTDIWQYRPVDLPRLEASRGRDLLWEMKNATIPPPTGTQQGVAAIQGALISKGQMAPATTGTKVAAGEKSPEKKGEDSGGSDSTDTE